jgi:copper(I)-binding protein
MNKIILLFFFLSLTPPVNAESNTTKKNDIEITEAWARATTPKMKNGCIYMIIKAKHATRLVQAAAQKSAKKTELHTHQVDENGVSRMREIPFLECPANQEVILKPQGNHVMLIGLKQPLTAGQEIDLTLTFDQNQKYTLKVPVKEQTTTCCGCK